MLIVITQIHSNQSIYDSLLFKWKIQDIKTVRAYVAAAHFSKKDAKEITEIIRANNYHYEQYIQPPNLSYEHLMFHGTRYVCIL